MIHDWVDVTMIHFARPPRIVAAMTPFEPDIWFSGAGGPDEAAEAGPASFISLVMFTLNRMRTPVLPARLTPGRGRAMLSAACLPTAALHDLWRSFMEGIRMRTVPTARRAGMAFAWAAALAATLAAAPASHADETAKRIAALEARVEALQEQNAALRAQLQAIQRDAAAESQSPVSDEADDAGDAVALRRERDRARTRARRLEAELTELEKLAGVTAKGELIDTAASLFETTYDEPADTTTVTARPRRAAHSNIAGASAYRVGGSFTVPGRGTGATPETYRLKLFTRANPNRWLKQVEAATLVFDGHAAQAPVIGYEVLDELKAPPGVGRPRTAGGVRARDERIAFALSAELAERIGRAQSLKLVLPRGEIELSREHIAMIEALRRRAAAPADVTP